MSYALRRGGQWITAPDGDGTPVPPVLAADNDPTDGAQSAVGDCEH